MQALVPLIAALSVVSGRLIIPIRPESDPAYQHYQNTKTGEYAYSYVGESSAKEETKDAEGVTRGSYNYVDANGNLQYTLYVADKDGFRVAATDLPYGYNLANADLLVGGRPVVSIEPNKLVKSDQNVNQQPKENSSQAEVAEKVKPTRSNNYDLLFPPATSTNKLVRVHNNVKVLKIGGDDVLSLIAPPDGWYYRRLDMPLVVFPSKVQDQGNPLGNPPKDADKEKLLGLDKPQPTAYVLDRNLLNQQLGLEGPNLQNVVAISSLAAAKDPVPAVKILKQDDLLGSPLLQEFTTGAYHITSTIP